MDAFLVHFKVLSLMFDLILPLDVDWIERQWRLLPASPDNPKTVYRVAFRQTWPRLARAQVLVIVLTAWIERRWRPPCFA